MESLASAIKSYWKTIDAISSDAITSAESSGNIDDASFAECEMNRLSDENKDEEDEKKTFMNCGQNVDMLMKR